MLPKSLIPVLSVPIRLPCTVVEVDELCIYTPFALLPEITLPSPLLVPPTTMPVLFATFTPSKLFPRSAEPLIFVPI